MGFLQNNLRTTPSMTLLPLHVVSAVTGKRRVLVCNGRKPQEQRKEEDGWARTPCAWSVLCYVPKSREFTFPVFQISNATNRQHLLQIKRNHACQEEE